jgi:hypothetical protein
MHQTLIRKQSNNFCDVETSVGWFLLFKRTSSPSFKFLNFFLTGLQKQVKTRTGQHCLKPYLQSKSGQGLAHC